MRKRFLFVFGLLLAAILILGACGPKSTETKENPVPGNQAAGRGFPLIIDDALGTSVTLAKKPEKIAVISGPLLDEFYSLGGKSICTVTPDEFTTKKDTAGQVPVIGTTSNPDMVKIMELQPDLVIAEYGLQNDVIFMLRQGNIPVIALRSGEQDMKETLDIMKKVAGIK